LKSSLPNPDLLRELADYRMPFGKYSGRRLVELPEPYLVWLQQKGMPSGKLGMLLETALVVRSNGLEPLISELIRRQNRP
jgi:uncharacterized protein